jgi:hypothetical protein
VSVQSSLAPHPPALRARRRQGTRWATARVFAPAVTLSVSGIAPEAQTIFVSPGYVSPQAFMTRIIAFVLAGRRFLHSNCRSETGRWKASIARLSQRTLEEPAARCPLFVAVCRAGMLCRFAVTARRSAARPGSRCRPLTSATPADRRSSREPRAAPGGRASRGRSAGIRRCRPTRRHPWHIRPFGPKLVERIDDIFGEMRCGVGPLSPPVEMHVVCIEAIRQHQLPRAIPLRGKKTVGRAPPLGRVHGKHSAHRCGRAALTASSSKTPLWSAALPGPQASAPCR